VLSPILFVLVGRSFGLSPPKGHRGAEAGNYGSGDGNDIIDVGEQEVDISFRLVRPDYEAYSGADGYV
jgi:hypothetical protein